MNDPEIEFLYSLFWIDGFFELCSIEVEQSFGLNPKPFEPAVCLLDSGLTYKVQSPACSKRKLVSLPLPKEKKGHMYNCISDMKQ
jgi:hypothetical protein